MLEHKTKQTNNAEPMNCWNRFEMKAAILFSKKPQNAEMLAKECARVGLDFIPFWGCALPYTKVLENAVRHTNMCSNAWFDITLNHNRIVRTAYELGKKNVLILEDDIRFLKDLDRLSNIVNALPEDYDIALLDWVLRGAWKPDEADALLKAPRVNRYWARFTDLRSCACWALSRKGMEAWLFQQEQAAHGKWKMCLCDQYYYYMARRDPTLKMYCSFPCCAEQSAMTGITNYNNQQLRYNRMGMKRDDYAPNTI